MEKVGDYLWGQTVAASKADLVSDIKLCCARIEKLQARIQELEEALRPFAEYYDRYGGGDEYTTIYSSPMYRKAKELLREEI